MMTLSVATPYFDVSFERTLIFEDGRCMRLRWLRSTDGDLVRDGFARMSMASRLARFFAPLHMLSDAAVEHLTRVDGVDRAAFVATSIPDALGSKPERAYGIARYVRLASEPTKAEVAVTVTDDAQGCGLGRRLFATLSVAARERGIETLVVNVLWGNSRARRLLADLGALRVGRDGEIVEYAVATVDAATRALAAPLSPASQGPMAP